MEIVVRALRRQKALGLKFSSLLTILAVCFMRSDIALRRCAQMDLGHKQCVIGPQKKS